MRQCGNRCTASGCTKIPIDIGTDNAFESWDSEWRSLSGFASLVYKAVHFLNLYALRSRHMCTEAIKKISWIIFNLIYVQFEISYIFFSSNVDEIAFVFSALVWVSMAGFHNWRNSVECITLTRFWECFPVSVCEMQAKI